MRRSLRPFLLVLALLATSIGQPAMVAGADPSHAPASHAAPPPTPAGAIVLPSGRILPRAPAGVLGPSEMAQQLQEHANDRIVFAPGVQPNSRSDSPTTVARGPLAFTATRLAASLPNGLRKQVLGFLPYWTLNATDLQWMRYGLISTIAYFGVAARSDGSLATASTGWSGWNSSAMTGVINAAHAKGARVVVTVTMMAWDSASAGAQAALLGNATYRTRLVANIVAAVRSRNADGVNLDFEPLATSLRTQYSGFVRQLKAALVSARVGSYLTICTTAGAATWATGYDLAGLAAASDGIFAMGYDYSWSGSSRAGGVAPMESSYMLDVNQSVTDFLSMMPASKLIWGVPYYGRTWRTTSAALNAATIAGASGSSRAYYYTGATSLAAAHGRRWDSLGQVPWFAYYDGIAKSYVEGYYDDVASLGVKYDMINRRGLGGMGMWHLLMDGGVSDLWNLIANKFQKDAVPPAGGIANLPPVTDAYAMTVRWRAIDVGAGMGSYTVQVRDRSSAIWGIWLWNTTLTSAMFFGTPGHSYEFRVAARDRLGNTQGWQPAMGSPGANLAAGGFASVAVDLLNVRAGAGTGFDSLAQLSRGQRVAVLSGPVSGSGYLWYQVQFAFSEWPSADYPRTGWAAAGDSTGRFLLPTVAPTVTTVSPRIAAYAPAARTFSPNGDARADSVAVSYSLPSPASSVMLDIVNGAGAVIRSIAGGAQASGSHLGTWDGHTASGSWAPAGTYLLRITAVDATGTHVAPTSVGDSAVLGRWGVIADLTPPSLAAHSPTGSFVAATSPVTVRFSEPVSGISGSTFSLVDVSAGTSLAATVTYDATTRTATLRPSVALVRGHMIRPTLGSGIRDGVGNAMAPTSWTFGVLSPLITVYNPPRSLTFAAGLTIGYRFDSTGRLIASKTFTLARSSSASGSKRSKAIPGHAGAWFLVLNGIWAGYWVPESSRAYLPGIAELVLYSPRRSVAFAPGPHTGYRFTTAGGVSGTKAAPLARSSTATADRWAIINGRSYVQIIDGIWAGYWMPVGGGVTVQ